jgi:SAM-dependent methyltransferase
MEISKVMSSEKVCPNCLSGRLEIFYEVHRVPVHSVLLMPTRQVAVNYPKGDIALGFCPACGFISNTLFDASVHEYSANYEETQGFSLTFRAFHQRLAESLIDKYSLRNKKIVEIGCGKGEFLSLICELGQNQGVGFDPAFVPDRNPAKKGLDIEFIPDFYSEKYAHVGADFFCCKMTLEHIPDTANFVRTVRRAVGDRLDSVVFFQVPDAPRVLRDLAFWDIYYEHCSYFSAGSLARVFREAGFEVLETWTDYDDQYLMISARPAKEVPPVSELELNAPKLIKEDIEFFVKQQAERVDLWKRELESMKKSGKRAVVWGSGSKGVAFLTALGLTDEIEYVVDINPFRQGKFMAGTGQEIVSPAFLTEYKPDVAIAMNPIYRNEIQTDLKQMGLNTSVEAV